MYKIRFRAFCVFRGHLSLVYSDGFTKLCSVISLLENYPPILGYTLTINIKH